MLKRPQEVSLDSVEPIGNDAVIETVDGYRVASFATGYSTASPGPTTIARDRVGALGWVSPLPGTSWWRTAGRSTSRTEDRAPGSW